MGVQQCLRVPRPAERRVHQDRAVGFERGREQVGDLLRHDRDMRGRCHCRRPPPVSAVFAAAGVPGQVSVRASAGRHRRLAPGKGRQPA